MRDPLAIRCVNCGTALELPPEGVAGVTCPVCGYLNELNATEALHLTADTLEGELGDLIGRARVSGITNDEIVRILRDELEFAAELASGGRHLTVQILDLGPLEVAGLHRPARERSNPLRGRSVGS